MSRKRNDLPGDPLLSTPEVAEYLSVDRSYARKLILSGELGPVIDVASRGERIYARVRLSEVEKYLAERTV